jgi:SAM-dependent methyltransferase
MLKPGVLCKICDAEDYFTPCFCDYTSRLGDRPSLNRKQWEYALIIRNMSESGALHDQADLLGLACGVEPIIYYAANRARSVLATDRYAGRDAGWLAGTITAADVYERAGFEYPRERLHVKAMDMRAIDAPDESFDLIWSASSIEHVDRISDLEVVFREVARALRPGGVHVFTTEWKLCGGFSYFPNGIIFDEPLLNRVTRHAPLAPIGPLDLSFSDHPLNTPVWRGLRGVQDLLSNIVLFSRGVLNTSFAFAQRKVSRSGNPIDVVGADPSRDKWLFERYRRMTRELGSPLARAKLAMDGTLGAWLAAARMSWAERG